MRIAYLTTDDVNPDLARRWAQSCGCAIITLPPRDVIPQGRFDAAIYDLDFLHPGLRERVLSLLLSGSLRCPAAIHSYNIRRREAIDLRARGVFVRRRMERSVLLRLPREVQRIRAEERRVRLALLPSPRRTASDSSVPGTETTFLAG